MPSTVANARYYVDGHVSALSQPSLLSQQGQTRVFLGLTHSVSWISLRPACTATLGPAAKSLPWLPCYYSRSANPLGKPGFGQPHDSHHSNTRQQITAQHDCGGGNRASLRLSLGDLHPTQAPAPSISNPNSQSLSTLDLRAQIFDTTRQPETGRVAVCTLSPAGPACQHACLTYHPTFNVSS